MSDETNSNHEPPRPPDAGCSGATPETITIELHGLRELLIEMTYCPRPEVAWQDDQFAMAVEAIHTMKNDLALASEKLARLMGYRTPEEAITNTERF